MCLFLYDIKKLSRIIGVKDINNEKESIHKIIESIENWNNTSIFHKVQLQKIYHWFK